MAYEELYKLQLALFALKKKVGAVEGLAIENTDCSDVLDMLPFELTGSQEKVTDQVMTDLSSHKGMNRLVQGDVGSGKTVIALLAMVLLPKLVTKVF